jgi:hypothetical protein
LQCCRLPASVQRIGSDCFATCLELEYVSFEWGSKLELIDRGAFGGCPRLSAIFVPLTVRHFKWNLPAGLDGLVQRTGPNPGVFATRLMPSGLDDEYLAGYLQAITETAISEPLATTSA